MNLYLVELLKGGGKRASKEGRMKERNEGIGAEMIEVGIDFALRMLSYN